MNKTFAALLTPPGKSALAVIGLCGSQTWEIVSHVFSPRSGVVVPEAGRWWLGRIGTAIQDEGIFAVRGVDPPAVEFQVHGGREIVRYLLDLLVERGATLLSWEDYLRLDEADERGELRVALAQALTTRTARILLDQVHGAFDREWQRGEEGFRDLERRIPIGEHLTKPFRVVIAGEPNVGKSSLVNALAGYQRAIVSSTPGTTRDVVSITVAIEGWPVELLDTAGLRGTTESLEEAGIAEARRAMTEADLVLWIVDAVTPAPSDPPEGAKVIVNKIDQPATWDLARFPEAPHVSAKTTIGIRELCEQISRWLVPQPPPPGVGVPVTARQVQRVRAAATLCRHE